MAQTDGSGDVNVSRFGKRVAGPGGFINITHNSKKVVFCGMFAIGSEEVIENGKLRITKQGDGKKFVERVEQITFSGAFAARKEFPVLFITERGVFRLENQQLILTEIAPGVDLERDIFAMMDFKPIVSPDLKLMDSALFQPKWGKLEGLLERNKGSRESDAMLAAS
jgi:propionate CoA-transferase